MRVWWYQTALALVLTQVGCGRLGFTLGGKDGPGPASNAIGLGDFASLQPIEELEGKHLLFMREDRLYRREASMGGDETDVSADLDAAFPGEDQFAGSSRSGEWLTLASSRLACGGDECLTLVRRDMKYFRRVLIGDEIVRLEGRAAVNDSADMIVFPATLEGGPHPLDLWAVGRVGEEWSEPLLLTGDLDKDYNTAPVFDPTGRRVLFDCGSTPSSQEDTSICEVEVGLAPAAVVIDVAQNPQSTPGPHALHHADYAGDDLVFESTWSGTEQLWRRTGGQSTLISVDISNDNTPCAFSDGSTASLWLNRPGGSGFHELKVMDVTGAGLQVLTPDEDLDDNGLSCVGSL